MFLLNSTNNIPADVAILKALEVIQREFPRPILSAYITGSYANGYAISTSDIDLYLIFKENLSKEEEELAEKLCDKLENVEPPLDIGFYGLPKLLEVGEIDMGKYFLHIHGESVHQKVSNPVRARTSIIRLGEILFPNSLSIDALALFLPQNDSQSAALLKSLESLKSMSQ